MGSPVQRPIPSRFRLVIPICDPLSLQALGRFLESGAALAMAPFQNEQRLRSPSGLLGGSLLCAMGGSTCFAAFICLTRQECTVRARFGLC